MAGERRYATVVFADVSGFTKLSEQLDPELVTELMNECFRRMEAAVERYGGHITRYVGDCIMAVFGAPTALEHAARQAVNAAIEMRNDIGAFGQSRATPVPIALHIGINSGLVFAGEVGGTLSHEFTAMGDSVNVASRLKDASPPGAIWVGAEVYRLTSREVEYRSLPRLRAKGKETDVEVFEVLSRRPRLHRAPPAIAGRMIASRLVGRERERDEIRACLRRLVAGDGTIVSIVGDAGMGKSRLLGDALASDGAPWTVLEGRSLSHGATLSFHPFIDLLQRLAGIGDGDAIDAAGAKLAAAIADVAPDDGEETYAFIATMMGLPVPAAIEARIAGMEGAALERMILKSVRELVRALAQRSPLVVVIEDLHWADLSSLSLWNGLLRLVADTRVCFVQLLRPDYAPAAQQVLDLARDAFAARHVEIVLDRLDARDSDMLVCNLVRSDELPHGIRELITRRAEGNPFYIEEVVRSLIDQGAIEQTATGFRTTATIDTVEMPASIHEVILSRIDHLPVATRDVLQLASVVGRRFPVGILADMAVCERPRLEAELVDLQRRQIVERANATEIEYVFKHALTQEAIYESILQRRRRELHAQVAEALESTYADRLSDVYAMLAFHYTRAERPEKAEEYLFRAGTEAARAAASNEALHFFQEASRLYLLMHGEGGDAEKKALLEKNIGLALLNRGNLPDSVAHFDHALVLLGERVPSGRGARARQFAGDALTLLARLATHRIAAPAQPRDREVFEIRYYRAKAQTTSDPQRFFFDSIGTTRRLMETDPRSIDQACGMYTAVAAMIAWSGLSFTLSKRFLAIAKTLVQEDNPRDLFGYQSWKFILHFLEGDWSDEHLVPEPLVEQALRWGQFWDVNTYRGLVCERHIHQGRFDAARTELARIVELADVYGYDFARTNQYLVPTLLLLQQRQLTSALPMAERYYAERREELLNLLALGLKAKIQVLAKDRAGAAETLAAGDALRRRAGAAPAFHASMLAMAHLLHDLGALEDHRPGGTAARRRTSIRRARRSLRRVLRVAREVARERPEAFRLAGRLAWLLGRPRRAVRWWERSLHAGRTLGAMPEVARTSLEIGRRLGGAGQPNRLVAGLSASAHRDEGARLLGELGLVGSEMAEDAGRSIGAIAGAR